MINLVIKIKMSGTIESPYRVLVITKPTETGPASTAPSSGPATVPVPGPSEVSPARSPPEAPGAPSLTETPGPARSGTADEEFFDAPEPSVITPVFVPTEPTTAPTPPPPAPAVAPDDAVPIVPIFGPEREIRLYLEMPLYPSKPSDRAGDQILDESQVSLEDNPIFVKKNDTEYEMKIELDLGYFETNAAYRFIKIYVDDERKIIKLGQSDMILRNTPLSSDNKMWWSKKASATVYDYMIKEDKILQEIFEFSTKVKKFPDTDSFGFLLEKIEEVSASRRAAPSIVANVGYTFH